MWMADLLAYIVQRWKVRCGRIKKEQGGESEIGPTFLLLMFTTRATTLDFRKFNSYTITLIQV